MADGDGERGGLQGVPLQVVPLHGGGCARASLLTPPRPCMPAPLQGAHMITPLPGATPMKPGSATLPFFGVEPAILDDKGNEVEGPGQG